ncbi:hypothetical protein FBU30_008209 [Linnemannia zychae]|nr:hypothetical protein FBU30_008209 [Linnemannia zychae]
MFKSTFSLGLLLIASAVSATSLTFWSDMYRQGQQVTCSNLYYDICYRLDDKIANLGLSSAQFVNDNMYSSSFAVTLYSGSGCNGHMDRWGFNRNNWEAPYYIEYYQSLNDNVRSFKIANRVLSTTSGTARSDEETTVRAPCRM